MEKQTYIVTLSRGYRVSVHAKNRSDAARFAEFFLGDCKDESTASERKKRDFAIDEVEMVINCAMEVEEVEEKPTAPNN